MLALTPAPTTTLSTLASTSRGESWESGSPVSALGSKVVTAPPSCWWTACATPAEAVPGLRRSAASDARSPRLKEESSSGVGTKTTS